MAPQNTAVGILLVFFVIFVILFFIGMARVNSREPCGYAQTTDKKKENAEKAAIFLKRDKKDLGTFDKTHKEDPDATHGGIKLKTLQNILEGSSHRYHGLMAAIHKRHKELGKVVKNAKDAKKNAKDLQKEIPKAVKRLHAIKNSAKSIAKVTGTTNENLKDLFPPYVPPVVGSLAAPMASASGATGDAEGLVDSVQTGMWGVTAGEATNPGELGAI